MRALILCPLTDDEVLRLCDERVRHLPGSPDPGADAAAVTLRTLRPHAVVTDRALTARECAAWHESMPGSPRVVVHSGDVPGPAVRSRYAEHDLSWRASGTGGAVSRALGQAERMFQQALLEREAAPVRAPRPVRTGAGPRREHVLVVGLGVVNLVTAHALVDAGFRVTAVDAGPDVRGNAPWQEYGATRGGGNARMFSLTEADEYHDTTRPPGSGPDGRFHRRVSEHGWAVHRVGGLPEEQARWADEFERVPPWLAEAYNDDIFAVNRRSGRLWADWQRRRPDLFDDVTLRHGLLRLYSDPDHLEASVERHRRIGALRRRYDEAELRAGFPALAGAERALFCGGLRATGFTLDVHAFAARLVDDLEASGAHVEFGRRMEPVRRGDTGRVVGLRSADGVRREADHYVLSPGAYGADLLRGTLSEGRVHGVLGCWLTLPDPAGTLTHSLKVNRSGHVAEDANVTVGHDGTGPVLVIGSGYGYTGADPRNVDPDELAAVHRAVADTARRLFPESWDRACAADPTFPGPPRLCVRPWTASSLGLFENARTARGRMVVTGGHNTGGFAQAPAVAEAVCNALAGRRHPMHVLYQPERLTRALDLPSLAAPSEEVA